MELYDKTLFLINRNPEFLWHLASVTQKQSFKRFLKTILTKILPEITRICQKVGHINAIDVRFEYVIYCKYRIFCAREIRVIEWCKSNRHSVRGSFEGKISQPEFN